MPRFPQKHFQFCHSKISKKVDISKCSKHSIFYIKVASKPFLKMLHIANLKLKPFERICFQLWFKITSTSSLANLQKSKEFEEVFNFEDFALYAKWKMQKSQKCHFQTLRKFLFDLKAASKPFPKMLPMTKFCFY